MYNVGDIIKINNIEDSGVSEGDILYTYNKNNNLIFRITEVLKNESNIEYKLDDGSDCEFLDIDIERLANEIEVNDYLNKNEYFLFYKIKGEDRLYLDFEVINMNLKNAEKIYINEIYQVDIFSQKKENFGYIENIYFFDNKNLAENFCKKININTNNENLAYCEKRKKRKNSNFKNNLKI